MLASAPTAQPSSAPNVDGLARVPLSALQAPGAASVDVYCLMAGAHEPNLLWNRNLKVSDEHFAEMRSRGIQTLWVNRQDYAQVASAVSRVWEQLVHNADYAPNERFVLFQIAMATQELDISFRMVRCNRYVESALQMGAEIASLLAGGDAGPRELFSRVQQGGGAAIRFTNISAYSVLLARLVGITAPENLRQIGVGAMLHDVGMRTLPIDAWERTGRLAGDQRHRIERHPQQSYEDLLPFDFLSRGQLLMAYQHHERIDGTGYPVGILGDEIHPWAKILSIVDRFDALTRERPARRALDLASALAQLDQAAGTQFDFEMTQCWTKSLR